MPRITNTNYLARHRQLKAVMRDQRYLLAALSEQNRDHLQAYFVPDQELSDADLLAHKQAVTSNQPALPSLAGKAFARLERLVKEHGTLSSLRPSRRVRRQQRVLKVGRRRQLIVTSELRETPDVRKIARAIIAMAMAEAEAEAKERAAADLDRLGADADIDVA